MRNGMEFHISVIVRPWHRVPQACQRIAACLAAVVSLLCPLPALRALQNQEHSFKQKVTGPLALVTAFRSQRPSRHRNLFKSHRSCRGLSCCLCWPGAVSVAGQAHGRSAPPPPSTQEPRENAPGGRFEFLLCNLCAGLCASVSLLVQMPAWHRASSEVHCISFLRFHCGVPNFWQYLL